MAKPLIVAKVPETYTIEQKKKLEESIRLAVEQTQVLVIPNEVDIVVLRAEK